MWSRSLGIVLALGIAVGVDMSAPRPAQAETFQLATTKYLVPPRGRLQKRKRIMDPSRPSAGRRYGPSAFQWFWNEVSPSRAAASSQRWEGVVRIIEAARARGKPIFGSQSTARQILKRYGPILEREAKRRNISLPLLVAVIAVESGGNPTARSPVGAQGLMQLMPPTAARFGVTNSNDPDQNIRGGAHYLDWLLTYFKNDAVLALAGYNAGEGAVERHAGVPPYRETRNYVAKVAGAYNAARRLCQTPPQGARDKCVLR